MSSFAGVEFTALNEGWSEPATSAVTVRGFPGGDNWAIHLAGQREITRSVSCLFADRGLYVNFVLQRGREGTLTIDNWDSVSAVLKDTDPGPPHPTGQIVAKATFVLV